MPTVRVIGWQSGSSPGYPSEYLAEFFSKEAGMDSGEAKAAIRRLTKGKSVDAYFDLGEDGAAQAFIKKVSALGLLAELHGDEEESWLGSRPRPWIIKCGLGALLGACILFWLLNHRPDAAITKVLPIVLLMFALSVPIVAGIQERRTWTEGQEERGRKLSFGFRAGLFFLVVVIVTIIAAPWTGVAVLSLALLGTLFAAIIRAMNRRD